MNIEGMKDEEFSEALNRKTIPKRFNDGNKQKLIEIGKLHKYLERGWDYINEIPSLKKAVVKLPE